MASKYLQKYPIPSKFQEILHDFSKEVLRAQEDDIILFAYQYFDAKAKGLEYKYESKFNVQKQGQSKQHSKVPHDQLTTKAQKVVQNSNQDDIQVSEKEVPRQQRSVTGKSGVSVKSIQAGSEMSHPEEKQLTKEFMGDIYNSALGEAVQGKNENTGEEHSQQQSEKSQNVTHLEEKQTAREFSSNIYDKAIYQISPDKEQQEEEEQFQGEDEIQGNVLDAEIETEQQREQREQKEYSQKQLGYGQEVQLDGKLEDYENAALKIQRNYKKKQGNK